MISRPMQPSPNTAARLLRNSHPCTSLSHTPRASNDTGKNPAMQRSLPWHPALGGEGAGEESEKEEKNPKTLAKTGERNDMTQLALKCNAICRPSSIYTINRLYQMEMKCQPASQGLSVSCHHRIVCTGGRKRDTTQQTHILASP